MATTSDVLPEKEARSLAEEVLPRGRSSDWHQAVMDLGAMICTARSPKCGACPLQESCRSAFSVADTPVRRKKPEPTHRGVPNRIWRGRTVEVLRSEEKIFFDTLLESVLNEKPAEPDEAWFEVLIDGLERDRMVQIIAEGESRYVALG